VTIEQEEEKKRRIQFSSYTIRYELFLKNYVKVVTVDL
jgi:hypothetical protein